MTIGKHIGAGLAVVVAAAAFAVGCGSSIDAADLEGELQSQLSADAGVDPANVSVDCPDDQAAEKGNEFDCELTAPNGDKVTVNVTITNDDGGFEAEVPPQQS
jgi:hypothetical protein